MTQDLEQRIRACLGKQEIFCEGPVGARSIFSDEDVFEVVSKSGEKKPVHPLKLIINYVCLTSIIFAFLLLVSNFYAYKMLVMDFFQPERLAHVEQTMKSGALQSDALQASIIETQEEIIEQESRREKLQKLLQKHLERKEISVKSDLYSAERFNRKDTKIVLNYEITPYQNRIMIPKIGKNIPLVDVEHMSVDSSNEWHKIFMRELANGVIKYPGSADPGEIGNSFIFGHSSNFPWAKGQYNEVFALLDKLQTGDEIITYHDQKKYTYKVFDKKVVKPGYVSALEASEERKLMTLMTCWPVGTTLNRLLVLAELTEEDLVTGATRTIAMQH